MPWYVKLNYQSSWRFSGPVSLAFDLGRQAAICYNFSFVILIYPDVSLRNDRTLGLQLGTGAL